MAAHNGHVRSKPVAVTLLLAEPAAVVTDTEAEAAAKLFKALSDPVRIRLVSLIRHSPGGEACFCDLAEDFNMPQPSLSHHLRVLVTAGVLTRERRGTWSWYSLVPEPLEQLGYLLREGGPLADRPAPITDTERNSRC
ncbi:MULTISPECIES: ArsR/SmtB family transcription factor [unclassified Amycolatopsis]|uniref:ArsR/SmtB family transcription factor n=1 Tax=unclassified Amycolatopsis TaxID=2618356 RepID=UPI002E0E6242|nr:MULTISPECIES: metalloregulator ArsR/SmtB family transcription factor [unclassified Amycolatopsis]WSJ81645.1 metalloregulator ArsR/SmtB family transcription factor [Amycolatopsis sp. NBC_01307]WSK74980.1 metalloregulator ArsR/SmtB family transcription factor [Amycolatopsis sp. NBC_01286]